MTAPSRMHNNALILKRIRTVEEFPHLGHQGLRRTLSRPYCTHSRLVAPICDLLP